MCTQCRAIARDVAADVALHPDDEAVAPDERSLRGLIAVDVGRVRIGLAWSPSGEGGARPLEVIARKGSRRDGARIEAAAEKVKAIMIIVGLPLEGDEPGTCSARLARLFAGHLARTQSRPVLMVDEAGTSAEAHAEMRLMGLRAARRRRVVDMVAAARILDRYLGGAPTVPAPTQPPG